MKLFRLVSISLVIFVSACSQSHGDMIVTDVPLGKIIEVSRRPDSVFVVKTSSGQTVYPRSLASINVGEEAVLVVREYNSGNSSKELCIKDDCVSLLTPRVRM